MNNPTGKENRHPLCDAVRSLREALGDTQQQFAHRLGMAISTVVRYELTRPPSGEALAHLQRVAQDANQDGLAKTFYDAAIKEAGLGDGVNFLAVTRHNDGSHTGRLMLYHLSDREKVGYAQSFFKMMAALYSPYPKERKRAAGVLKELNKKSAWAETAPGAQEILAEKAGAPGGFHTYMAQRKETK
jgi:transcriptional regulator with XRE-family HTH domain